MRRFTGIRVFTGVLAIALLDGCGGGSGEGGGSGTQFLTITAKSPPTGTTGVTYAGYTFTASGGVAPLTWTEGGPLPPGLTLSASGQLLGNPSRAGTYSISVTVSDSSMPSLTASAPVSLKVSDSAITVASASPPPGTVSYTYPGFTFGANGGSLPYTWVAATGTLPPGLTVGGDGSLSGTPTQTGTFSFSVTPTDSAQTPVKGPTLPVQITINNPSQLVLKATPAPPGGVDGAPYEPFNFTATGGFQPLRWSVTGKSLPPGLTLDANDGSLSGTPTRLGTFNFTVTVRDSAPTPAQSSVQFIISVAQAVAPLGTSRSWHSATRLTDGSVLVAGGATGENTATATATAEVYNPADNASTPTGLMLSAREAHTATLLTQGQRAGQVLIAGGSAEGSSLQTAELYYSVTGRFAATGNMLSRRSHHTATLLPSGKVLIAGGTDGSVAPAPSAEIYDPATGRFAATGNMVAWHSGHAAAPLANGKVLIAGGSGTEAEIYDPVTGAFKLTGPMLESRVSLMATTLPSGQVLITGGFDPTGLPLSSAEIYDPASGRFAAIGAMAAARARHTAVLREDGSVLIVGGSNHIHTNSSLCSHIGCPPKVLEPTASVEIYNPKTRLFATTVALANGRDSHTATLLADGVVLVAGGEVVKQGIYGGGNRCCIVYDYLAVTASVELK